MALFDRFQAAVGRDQGANRLFIRDDGFFNIGDVRNGKDGDDITGTQIWYAMMSPHTRHSVTMASVPETNSILPSFGVVYLWQSVTYNSVSMKMPSAHLGAVLIIQAGMVQSNIVVWPSGMSLAGIRNSDLSTLTITNGSANSAWIEFRCFVENCWAIVRYSDRVGIVENPS